MRKGKFLLLLAGCAVLLGLLFRFLIWTGSSPTVQVMPEQKPVIVIDAGHGGMDGGASSADGVQEKDINLAIAKCLQEEMRGYPVEVKMTRTDDRGLYTDDERPIRQKKREDLLNRKKMIEQEDVILGVSIHLNSFPQDEKVYGAQVFYPPETNAGTTVSEQEYTAGEFAEAIQKSLETNISDGRERSAMSKNDILLFQDTDSSVLLVECGFLSNPNECMLLQTAEYQRLLASCIWQGINEILYLKKVETLEIIDSANKSVKTKKSNTKICG